jgi:hypothetical protein
MLMAAMSDLANAVCSVTATQRGRYFWAAWWTGQPSYGPFRKPDASNGGFASEDAAFAAAEKSTGRHLTRIEPYWARAWNRMLRGEAPPPPPTPKERKPPAAVASSAWSVLGLEAGASLAQVKRAYRQRALETHPDRGGEEQAFLAVQRAYEQLCERIARGAKRRR